MHNYWSTDPYMPQHRMMKELGMKEKGEAGKDDNLDDDDDDILEFRMDCDAVSDGESSIKEE
eukprot:13992627-Ditylum_brightwellii.AAC.1